MLGLLLGAQESAVQTYLPTIFSSAGLLALLSLLWRIQRQSDRDKVARIEQLHKDIGEAENRNDELRKSLEDADDRFREQVRRADQLQYEGEWCARRLDFLIDVVEQQGIEVPITMKPQLKDGDS
jgi:hypothetical protein